MAQKAVKKYNINNIQLETRILATFSLIEICKMDADNITPKEIEELYKKIAELNEKAFEDEKTFNVVATHKLDEINSTEQLKERIKRNRVVSTYKQLGYFGLSSGTTEQHIPQAPEILATIMHNIGIKDADALSIAACTGELSEEDANKLIRELNNNITTLKKNLARDFETYKDQKSRNPSIELIYNDLEEYTYDKNKSKDLTFTYGKSGQKEFCKAVRADFNDRFKPDFLNLYGTMMSEGKNAHQSNMISSNYPAFCQMIEKNLGVDKAKTEIDLMLNISPNESSEAKRKEAYKEKCSEIYFKTIAAILSQKYDYNKEKNLSSDYEVYMRTINHNYISDMCKGENNITALAFQDANDTRQTTSRAEEHRLSKENRDESAEKQIISIHHKLPVGASYDICDQILPNYPIDTKVEKACELTNNLANMVYVVGKDKHQSLEAKGSYKIGQNPDIMIFAATINCDALRKILPSLPKHIQDGIKKYVKFSDTDKSKDISANMKFSEHNAISAQREKLGEKKENISITQKYARYYGA